MKFLSLILLSGCVFLFCCKKDLTIKYYYNGPFPLEIQKGLEHWHSKNFLFEKTNFQEDAYLKIFHTSSREKTNPNWIAQYNHRSRTILIYDKASRLGSEELIGIVCHEAGHFLGLDHNDEFDSIMNIKTPYDTIPSATDKQRTINLMPTLFVKKTIDEKILKYIH